MGINLPSALVWIQLSIGLTILYYMIIIMLIATDCFCTIFATSFGRNVLFRPMVTFYKGLILT